ncbi:processed acidic surface protein [Anaerocolumna sp. MB42-C2]|uniref:processed acidic surface protein n=1 Tax=Anaerocolumna sp. MB42-C2 TaxID=3070997 RepID=UPI0027E0E264|nr:processed acidic surface protein [Anaerocolumna sp. MB42-C2]WMJ87197.1 processed acidic surface protein [Anaerocolumna sp. MB42-C2]
MKKVGVILLIFSLILSIFPKTAFAAENTNFDQELIQYLNEVSVERGFEVSKENIEAILSTYDERLKDFDSAADLKSFLGEVIKADFSNLSGIYENNDLDQEKLEQLLKDNGETLEDYIYLNDLVFAVYFYQENGEFVRDPDFDQKFAAYLTKISSERGFEVTKETVEAALADYDMRLDNFETVEQVSDFLGEVIQADLSNLDYIYETYDLDKEALLKLLENNGKEINNFIFLDDLEEIVWTSNGGELPGFDDVLGGITSIMGKIGLTEDELQKLMNYFLSMEDYFSDPALEKQLDAIGNRLLPFYDLADTKHLTDGQISELASIYEDLLSFFKLNAVLTFKSNGKETPISFEKLFQMLNNNELKDFNLIVELFGSDSQLLADFNIPSNIFGELVDVVEDSTEGVINAVDKPAVTKPAKSKPEVKTIKGGKLPKTSSDYLPNALIGLFFVLTGVILYRKLRNEENEIIKESPKME